MAGGVACVDIPIIDDTEEEETENITATVTIVHIDFGALQPMVTVNIVDNDG